MIVCGKCKGSNVQLVQWTDPNTEEVFDMYSSDYACAAGRFSWCGDCGEHTELEEVSDAVDDGDADCGDGCAGDTSDGGAILP